MPNGFWDSSSTPRRVMALLALIALACASSGGASEGAASPDELDCSSLELCDDKLTCSGGAQCFKLKSCPKFVCASVEEACRGECHGGGKCLVLESQPMLLTCR
jgi:hypothetical protein